VSRQIDLSRVDARVVQAATIACVLAVAALLGRIGSDSQWLVALGHDIARSGSVPSGIPFAGTPTAQWPNSLVLAELTFDGLDSALGVRGLLLAQLLAVAIALVVLARDARAGGADPIGVSGALLIASVGALPALAIVRVQLFSIALFPVLLLLLRDQARTPSRRIWLVLPLLALWSNLHGGALLGLGVTLGYLALDRGRRRPLQSGVVAVCSAAALCATPALLRTVDYYHGVLTNAAAQQGSGEWGPLSLTSPLDIVLALAALTLLWRVWRARPPLWEGAVLVVLAVLTVRADRNGVWLLLFAVAPAAQRLAPARSLRTLTPVVAVLAAVLLVVSIARGPASSDASPGIVARAIAMAHGTPVLADGTIDEQVAMAGGRIWAGDPIDAFPHAVQVDYLDWLAGDRSGVDAVTPAVHVALVARGSATARLMARMPDFVAQRSVGDTVMYERVRG
jgi:hypothetical protein